MCNALCTVVICLNNTEETRVVNNNERTSPELVEIKHVSLSRVHFSCNNPLHNDNISIEFDYQRGDMDLNEIR